jgi:arginyl-tRNA synthetase
VIRDHLIDALRRALTTVGVEPLPEVIGLERPARREHGDWSSNVAMATAKKVGKPPRELAQALADALNADPPRHVVTVEVAGPGFVNFRLADTWLHDVLAEVVEQGPQGFGRLDLGRGKRVNVEFVSANPTGPLHAGHGRGAVYGDSLARLLERCGYDVTREFYLNDRGTQMGKFAASLAARRAGDDVPEDGYRGQYIVDWAAELPADADPLEWGYTRALADQREVLHRLRVHFDVWSSERELLAGGAVEKAIDDLRARDMVYEADGATWLRSTTFGDDKDRVLRKGDGELTYLTPDIAYHRDKFERGFDLLVDVWGADHHGYVPRMKAAMQALGHDPAELEVVITQLVKLMRGDDEVRLSKRSGDIIELRDVVDEVGADATRLTYLLQSVDSKQTFDLELATSRSMDNPVYYVQMAHARVCSIARVAAERDVVRRPLAEVDLGLLVHERELEVLRALSEHVDIVTAACNDRAPHRVVAWLRELAGAVHGFYHDCYVMGDGISPELTQARLWLVEAARVGLVSGLDLIGVSAPESM